MLARRTSEVTNCLGKIEILNPLWIMIFPIIYIIIYRVVYNPIYLSTNMGFEHITCAVIPINYILLCIPWWFSYSHGWYPHDCDVSGQKSRSWSRALDLFYRHAGAEVEPAEREIIVLGNMAIGACQGHWEVALQLFGRSWDLTVFAALSSSNWKALW